MRTTVLAWPTFIAAIAVTALLAGCATEAPPPSNAPAQVLAQPTAIKAQEHSCHSLFLLSDLTRGQLLSGQDGGREFEIPVGEWLSEALNNSFWLDSQAQPDAARWALGFAPGTGIRQHRGQYEVQLLLQIQYSRAQGHAGFAGVAGSARNSDPAAAVSEALAELLTALSAEMRSTGLCRSLASK